MAFHKKCFVLVRGNSSIQLLYNQSFPKNFPAMLSMFICLAHFFLSFKENSEHENIAEHRPVSLTMVTSLNVRNILERDFKQQTKQNKRFGASH